MYQLALPAAGRSTIEQGDSSAVLGPADWTLSDSSRPHGASHSPQTSGLPDQPKLATSVTVLIPHHLLPLPRTKVSALMAARIPSGHGMGALAAQLVRQISRHPDRYDPSQAPVLASTVLSLVAGMVAQQL